MHKVTGAVRLQPLNNGAARLLLCDVNGAQTGRDLSADEAAELADQLFALRPKKSPQEGRKPRRVKPA